MIDSDFSGCKVTNFSPHKLMIFHRICNSACRYKKNIPKGLRLPGRFCLKKFNELIG